VTPRAADERLLLDRGLLGQETVGAAGFAKALRTIPPMLEIARAAAARAPQAWLINFTNPVGIITEAVRKAARARIIGICDTPLELFEGIAQALGAPMSSLHFDYFGLNHLGWVKGVFQEGVDRLPELLKEESRLESVYRHRLFDAEFVRSLGVLPSEYLYYYYSTEKAVANLRRAGQSRAEAVARMNAELWTSLARPDDPLHTYERYLAGRNATYMDAETGAQARAQLYTSAAGYDRIALAVMTAIHGHTRDVIPVDVDNRGAVEGLEDDDVVEVPCVIGLNGALPLATGRPPAGVAKLLHFVKHYERMTVSAALEGSAEKAAEALAANPLIRGRQLADELLGAFRTQHAELLSYLR